jgi:hypothetical protein
MVKSNVTAMAATKKSKKDRELLLRLKLLDLRIRMQETDRRLDESIRNLDRMARYLRARGL